MFQEKLIYRDRPRSMVAWSWNGNRGSLQKGMRNLSEVMEKF